jgi:Ser-tRNA(Ala) deacylase AlaX
MEVFDFSVFKEAEVRIVGIANFLCPCGGTHVPSTSHLSDFEVTGIKRKKGALRVKYDRKKAQ